MAANYCISVDFFLEFLAAIAYHLRLLANYLGFKPQKRLNWLIFLSFQPVSRFPRLLLSFYLSFFVSAKRGALVNLFYLGVFNETVVKR